MGEKERTFLPPLVPHCGSASVTSLYSTCWGLATQPHPHKGVVWCLNVKSRGGEELDAPSAP